MKKQRQKIIRNLYYLGIFQIFVLLIFSIPSAFAQLNFTSPTTYGMDAGPGTMLAGDFDQDGDVDVATAHANADILSVRMNNGDGTFGSLTNYSGGIAVSFAGYVCDLNNDNYPDILTGAGSFVRAFLNNGDGSFAAPVSYTVGLTPDGIYCADFDNDNDLDVVTSNYNGDNFSYLENMGNGTFATKVDYSSGDQPYAIVGADLNNDGFLDVVVSNNGETFFTVFLNNGDGTFAAGVNHSVPINPIIIRSGDFDGDGNADVAMVLANNSVSMLNGDGTGSFSSTANYSASGAFSVEVADLDNDGDTDLLTTNFGNNSFSYLFNDGSGNFGSTHTVPIGLFSSMAAIQDYNNDGVLDVAISHFTSDNFSVLFQLLPPLGVTSVTPSPNALDVSLSSTIQMVFDVALDTGTVHQGSFPIWGDQQGLIDGSYSFTTTNVSNDTVSFTPADPFLVGERVILQVSDEVKSLEGRKLMNGFFSEFFVESLAGSGTFSTPVFYSMSGTSFGVDGVDVNNDRLIDLISANIDSDSVSVRLNNGDGTFSPNVNYAVSEGPNNVMAVDLDKDGDHDLVVSCASLTDAVSVLMNNGDGTFAAKTDYSVGDAPWGLALRDYNGDGFPDVAVANRGDDTMSVLMNNGDGTLSARVNYPTGNFPFELTAADFDLDGDVDLATANADSGDMSVFFNVGNGTFSSQVLYDVGDRAEGIDSADLDGDGDIDLVTANSRNSGDISVLLNDGTGVFSPSVEYPLGSHTTEVMLADLDADGDLDVSVPQGNDSELSVLLNNGNGTYAPRSTYPAGSSPTNGAVGDFNLDGALDVAVTGFVGGVSILSNLIVNAEPVASIPNAITQANDGSGYVTFETTVSDSDNETTFLQVLYSDDGGSTFYDAHLVSATPDSGTVDLDNSSSYQIGSVDAIDTDGGDVTLTIVWDSQSVLNANGALSGQQNDIQLRVIPNDNADDGTAQTSSNFTVDNQSPVGLTELSEGNVSSTEVELQWTAVTENNFSHYEIWYGEVQTDVVNRTGTAVEWDNSDDLPLATLSTTSTTIPELDPSTSYYFKIFAIDLFGNEETVLELLLSTSGLGGRRRSFVQVIEGSISDESSEIIEDTSVEQEKLSEGNDEEGPSAVLHEAAETEDDLSALEKLQAIRQLFLWLNSADYQLLGPYKLLANDYEATFRLKTTFEVLGRALGYGNGYEYRYPEDPYITTYADLFKALMIKFSGCFSADQLERALSHDVPENPWWWAGYWYFLGEMGDYEFVWDMVDGRDVLSFLDQLLQGYCPLSKNL